MQNSLETGQDDLGTLAAVELGEEGALASLYDRHSTWVYSVALRVCRGPVLAQEVLQTVFMRVWVSPRQFFPEVGRLDGRLGTLARDLAVDLIRKRESSLASPHSRFDPVSPARTALPMQQPATGAPIPDLDRSVLEMAFFDGKTSIQICRETGVPLDTIGSRVSGTPGCP